VKAQMSCDLEETCLGPYNDIGSIYVAHIGMHHTKTW
jgi:hypothetical protein